ncbi:hypothetical protein V6N13_020100 [Hibiscus sabdariffa]|uniref:Uncharacterized protein n=1 Tax=Hibiscus sabdariffa TaxID=183260 RepID=A0ABR2ESG6_9ROSI
MSSLVKVSVSGRYANDTVVPNSFSFAAMELSHLDRMWNENKGDWPVMSTTSWMMDEDVSFVHREGESQRILDVLLNDAMVDVFPKNVGVPSAKLVDEDLVVDELSLHVDRPRLEIPRANKAQTIEYNGEYRRLRQVSEIERRFLSPGG